MVFHSNLLLQLIDATDSGFCTARRSLVSFLPKNVPVACSRSHCAIFGAHVPGNLRRVGGSAMVQVRKDDKDKESVSLPGLLPSSAYFFFQLMKKKRTDIERGKGI